VSDRHARAARRTATLAAVLCAALLVAPGAALGDGDPASDVLPLQDLYLPYSPPVSAPIAEALRTLLKQTRAAGYPVKVAIIATPTDLGAVPNLFGQPQRYAAFLGSEISFNSKNTLLVVMASGYGAVNLPAAATSSLQGVPPPAGGGSDVLAKAAITAVVRLAKAAGHPVAAPKVAGRASSGGGSSPAVIFGAPVALLALAGILMAIRRRSAPPAGAPAAAVPGPGEPPPAASAAHDGDAAKPSAGDPTQQP
jgi:MYXO-CTERM domain-containing protein